MGFKKHMNAIQLKLPIWEGEGLYEVSAQTVEGTMFPAFLVYKWFSDTTPTIIFNHGAFEYPFDRTFSRIFDKQSIASLKVNLIIIRTPFHRHRGELKNGIKTLSRFMAAMAVSTKLTEVLLASLRSRGSKRIEVAGISLGGVVANRHRVLFNSADIYIPIIAGTAHEKLFINSRVTSHIEDERHKTVFKNLNFSDEWFNITPDNVFPINARFDDYCRIYEQGPSYGDCEIEIWNLGHLTTSLSCRALNTVLLRKLLF